MSRVIMNCKIYDTAKAEEICKFRKKFLPLRQGLDLVTRKAKLYRTPKGNWFSVSLRDYEESVFSIEDTESVRSILLEGNHLEIYDKYFEKLEEA